MISIMVSFWTEAFSEVFKTLLYMDGVIYGFIARVFSLIIDLSSANFITTDIVDMLLERIYIIVGVLALFLISYALIKSLFDPNNAFKGKKSAVNVIKNMMIAIVLTVLMPTIFTYLYRFQSIIIDSNVISAIILGSGSDSNGVLLCARDPGRVPDEFLPKNPTNKTCGEGYKLFSFNASNSGYRNYVKMASDEMSFTALNTFLFAEDEYSVLDKPGAAGFVFEGIVRGFSGPVGLLNSVLGLFKEKPFEELTFADIKFEAVANRNFMFIVNAANALSFGEGADASTGQLTYYMGLSTICGLALLGLAVVTCVNLALRILKLFALEILSPIACFSMVIPDSKIFDRWLKETISTYLDLFFRLITFNLCILLFGQIYNITQSFEGRTGLLLDIFIIAGLLIFINEAPKMIKDILGIKTNDQKLLKRMFGGTVGSVLSGGAGFLGGIAGGAIGASHAGFDPGAKGLSKARNIGMSALSGVGIGKNAAKAKNFGDWKNAIDSGIKKSAKANQNRNINDIEKGKLLSKEGIKNRLAGVGSYVSGISPTGMKKFDTMQAGAKGISQLSADIEDIAKKDQRVVSKQNELDQFNAETFKNRYDFRNHYLKDKLSDIEYQRVANDDNLLSSYYNDYLSDRANKADEINKDIKKQIKEVIKEQAGIKGTDIYYKRLMQDEKIKHEIEMSNEFLSSANGFDMNALSSKLNTGDVAGYVSDIKDMIEGKSQIVNETVFSHGFDGSGSPINLGVSRKVEYINGQYVVTDQTESKRRTEMENVFSLLPNYNASLPNIDQIYHNLSNEIDNIVRNFNQKNTAGFNAAVSNYKMLVASLGINANDASVDYKNVINKIASSINSGINRNASDGSIQTVMKNPNYIDTKTNSIISEQMKEAEEKKDK